MYDLIAKDMNLFYGCSDMDSDLVENYLRDGDTSGLISAYEAELIEDLLYDYL